MAGPLRVALIGAGNMGSVHADSLAWRVPGARLVAIADPSEESARRVLAELGRDDVRYERDYQQVLVDPSVDAVAIASPGATHPEVIAAAAQAGKPTFCEKPLGHSLEAAERALEAVERSGTLLQIGFQRRFDPAWIRAHGLASTGALGKIHLLRSITRDPAFPLPGRPMPWMIVRETLIHDFDSLRWLAGSDAVEVYAMGEALDWATEEQGVLDTALVSIRFANGAMATADASFRSAYGYDVRAEVYGSNGMATAGDGRVDTAWHYSATGVNRPQVNWYRDLFGASYLAEMAHFVECVKTGQAPAVTGQDGRASLVMADAAVESMQTQRPVKIDLE